MAGIFRAIAAGLETKSTDISALTWRKLFGDELHVKSGVSVSIDTALKVSTVLACARVLANGIAQVPLKVYREDGAGTKQAAKDHPLYNLLWRRPNEWMTSFEYRQMAMFHAVLTGNHFAYIGRGGAGKQRKVVELIPLLPGRVKVCQDEQWNVFYEVYDRNGMVGTFPRTDILHLRGPSWNGYCGMDAVMVAREAIGLAIATEETHARLHANSARPGGLFSVEGELGDAAYNRIKAQIDESRSGLNSAFKTWVLDKGAKWTPMLMNGVDAEHLNTRRFQIEEICRDLGVFPQMVGYTDKTATFASAESFFMAHVVHSISPWVENWQQTLARDLFPDENNLSAEFTLQSLMRGDHKTRAEFYASGIVNGWLTRNEARKLENLNPIDGLDAPLVPLNMGTQADKQDLQQQLGKAMKSMLLESGAVNVNASSDLALRMQAKVAEIIESFTRERNIQTVTP
jgi:HK97 family phage portal protein